MVIHTVSFVLCSELWKGASEFWNEWFNSDPSFTWGDTNRTLVSPSRMLNSMFDKDGTPIVNFKDVPDDQIELVRSRLNELDESTYIDLEN